MHTADTVAPRQSCAHNQSKADAAIRQRARTMPGYFGSVTPSRTFEEDIAYTYALMADTETEPGSKVIHSVNCSTVRKANNVKAWVEGGTPPDGWMLSKCTVERQRAGACVTAIWHPAS